MTISKMQASMFSKEKQVKAKLLNRSTIPQIHIMPLQRSPLHRWEQRIRVCLCHEQVSDMILKDRDHGCSSFHDTSWSLKYSLGTQIGALPLLTTKLLCPISGSITLPNTKPSSTCIQIFYP